MSGARVYRTVAVRTAEREQRAIERSLDAIEQATAHKIAETFVEERTQTVRCICGRSAMFSRRRDYLGAVVDRAHDLAEFVCTGEVITLRASIIKEAQ